MEPDFQNLIRLGRARASMAELEMVMELLAEYESRGSEEIRRVLEPIRKQLQSSSGRQSLGITLEGRFEGLD
jgi:hypothetical protein